MAAPVVDAILGETQDPSVREAMLLGSHLEGGWSPPFGVGDSGTSFGPYQIHLPAHPGVSRQQAEDVGWSTDFMWPSYVSGVLSVNPVEWIQSPEMAAEKAAFRAEAPLHIYHEARGQATVDAAWADTIAALRAAGQPLGPGGAGASPGAGDPSGGGSTGSGGTPQEIPPACRQALQDVISGKISKDQCSQICGAPCTSDAAGGLGGLPVVGGPITSAAGVIGSLEDAIKFVFTFRFLEIVGGGALILLGIYLLGRQLGVAPSIPGAPG